MINCLEDIPNSPQLKQLCQSIAMLEAIIMSDWEYRYYSFKTLWDNGTDVFSMRNGSGDEMFVIFIPDGVLIKGFAHESPYSPYQTDPPRVLSGVVDSIPKQFKHLMQEPAFLFSDTTFCCWQKVDSQEWSYGRQPTLKEDGFDGSLQLLAIFDGKPETYHQWASEYYEEKIPLESVKEIYAQIPLNSNLIESINADYDIKAIVSEAREIAYPIGKMK